ncbi:MAG: FISUMP domain-containing protein, partial [Parcubacteria group bacterium]
VNMAVAGSSCTSVSCGDTCKYNENEYETIKIGNQCWFAENLRTSKKPDGTALAPGVDFYCYDAVCCPMGVCPSFDGGLEVNFGGSYTWTGIMNGASSDSIAPGPQGICPSGWHIPTDSEFFVLEDYLKNSGETCDASRFGHDCRGAGDGFRGIFGLLYAGKTFWAQGWLRIGDPETDYPTTFVWSATESATNIKAFCREITELETSSVHRTTVGRIACPKDNGYSVRCLRD